METGVDKGSNLSSIIERNDLDEFVATAMLEQREFTAERGSVTIVSDGSTPAPAAVVHAEMYDYERVAIPRRPSWDTSTTRDELESAERAAFLDWRRDLALTSQASRQAVTPYEKNLEVWRQLWRVVERSDLIVQIVDARNPLLFYCKDLVGDLDQRKRHLLVVNKADFLSDHMRASWAEYFAANGVDAVFFSAKDAVALQELQRAAELNDDDDESEFDSDADLSADDHDAADDESDAVTDDHVPDDDRAVLNTQQLMRRFLQAFWGRDDDADADQSITVGLVGYPNVGKSSIINALLGEKKVGVAAMPGKTRHFQTLILNDAITLCDCPGLVFPTFVNSQADLVCNGIIPIDRLRDYLPPVELVARRVHKRQFAGLYGLRFADLDSAATAVDLLSEFARVRGLMTGRGLPDLAMASRYVLKDFASGRLLYCHPPPDCDPATFLQSLQMPDVSARRPQQGPVRAAEAAPDPLLLSTLSSATPAPGQGMAYTGSAKGVKKALKMARARQKALMRAAEPDAAAGAAKRRAPKGAKPRNNVIAVTNY